MRKSTFSLKATIGKIHLWLGFTSGLVIFIVSLTGCIYTFQHELKDLTQSYLFVEEGEEMLSAFEIIRIGEDSAGKTANRLYLYGADRSAQVMFYGRDYYEVVYINQYTGEVLQAKNMYWDFFTIVLEIHMRLLLPGKVGELIVPVASLIFLLMLVSGLVLWWPKSGKVANQRFSVKWKAKWRRLNYDLHGVLGFYACCFLFVIVCTGLVWSFKWFESSVYWVVSGGKSVPAYPGYVSDTTRIGLASNPIDRALAQVMAEVPAEEKSAVLVLIPQKKEQVIAILTNDRPDQYRKMRYHYFDQSTLEKLATPPRFGPFEEAEFADKLLKMNYDLHTGGILGFTGKVLAFLASLISASLPITGFLVWWGRRKKASFKVANHP